MKTVMQLIKFYCKNVPKLPHFPLYTSNIYRALSVHQPPPWALASRRRPGLSRAHVPGGSGPCLASKAIGPISDIPTQAATWKLGALSSTSSPVPNLLVDLGKLTNPSTPQFLQLKNGAALGNGKWESIYLVQMDLHSYVS